MCVSCMRLSTILNESVYKLTLISVVEAVFNLCSEGSKVYHIISSKSSFKTLAISLETRTYHERQTTSHQARRSGTATRGH